METTTKNNQGLDVLEERLSLDNIAFIRAVREGIFDQLTPHELNLWGRLTTKDKSEALLPWREKEEKRRGDSCQNISYLKTIIREAIPRY